MNGLATTHRVVTRGDYSIHVLDCTTGSGLFVGIVFVAKRGEPPAVLASHRALTIDSAFAKATRWLDDWAAGDYRVNQPSVVDGVA